MNLLTQGEKALAAGDVRDLILASGQEADLLRIEPGERLYGSDDASYAKVGSFRLEFVEIPPEDLSHKIDAVACVLPEVDVRPEDHVQESEITFRVQTVEDERLFGVLTHKVLKLVRLHGS